jgi:hypothetical protein
MLTKEQKRMYMRHYVAHCKYYECPLCFIKTKTCYKYKHNQSKHHKMLENFMNSFGKSIDDEELELAPQSE